MKPSTAYLRWVLLVAAAGAQAACCHGKPPPPPPPGAEYRECRHPKLAEVDRCLATCAEAGPGGAAVCRRSCCGTIGDIGEATPEEKSALRECRVECR